MDNGLAVREQGVVGYEQCWRRMREFTAGRGEGTPDELWLLEHEPVYTLGLAGERKRPGRRDTGIPLVHSDRGGQITYHGPGQAIAYLLLDLRRRRCGPRAVVTCMEEAVISVLSARGVESSADPRRPGVYVDGRKIAAVGLRVRRGCCYHGVSLNVDMDLAPFADIDPCGYAGLEVCRLRDLDGVAAVAAVKAELAAALAERIAGLARCAILPPVENG